MKAQGFVKIDGQLKEIENIWVKVGLEYKTALEVSEKQSGQWEEKWAINRPVPIGTVIAWAGTAAEIPRGWFLCDGNNGTPDLIDRFIMGGISPGKTGGSETHSHTLSMEGEHTHTVARGGDHDHMSLTSGDFLSGYRYLTEKGAHTHSALNVSGNHNHGGTKEASNDPPYFHLAFIMKGEVG